MEANLKKILRSVSLELRHILEGRYDEHGHFHPGDLERRLNEIGIWRDRSAKPAEEMPHLSVVDRSARTVIDAYILFRKEAGVSLADAVAEFVRESAYTWANRLFALRCMEARAIIDDVILQKDAYGGRSMVHNRFARKYPEACRGEDDGLFAVLSDEFLVRAEELPTLFESRSPAIALRPSIAALKRCIALLSGREAVRAQEPANDEVFSAPDAFGWAYQYWNAEEKDRVFEMVRTQKGSKIEGADIIPATQLYTEPYMVKFLVQNSLGAIWMGMHPESRLCEKWEFYVKDAERSQIDIKSVKEITFLDPAVGSGHFLLEGFDLFFDMYEEEGKLETLEEICASILNNNLFGIDIDGRAVQIATAALWMKAKEKAPNLIASDISGFRDHLIATNIRLPKNKDHLEIFLTRHPEDEPLRPALEKVFQGLVNAHELGSLLQIDEQVERALKDLKQKDEIETAQQFKNKQGVFWDVNPQSVLPFNADDWKEWKVKIIDKLVKHFSDESEIADISQSFFVKSAHASLSYFDITSRRFTVVTANPPYMHNRNMGKSIRTYLTSTYVNSNLDLYTAFIDRCHSLLSTSGYVAMVVQQSYMFLNSHKKLRAILGNNYLISIIAHLGSGAFNEISGEKVNTVLYCSQNVLPTVEQSTFIRLVNSDDKSVGLKQRPKSLIYRIQQKRFSEIPGEPWVYWLPNSIFRMFRELPAMSSRVNFANRTKTGDNAKYLRFFWEISPSHAGSTDWPLYTKGGEYSKWFGNNNYCVKWDKATRQHFRESSDCRITDEEYWFQEGITYTDLCSKGFNGRYIIPKSVYDVSGPVLFDNHNNKVLLGLLNTPLYDYLLRLLNPTMHVQSGDIARLPMPCIDDKTEKLISKCVDVCIESKENIISRNISEYSFALSKFTNKTLRSYINDELVYNLSASLSKVCNEQMIYNCIISSCNLDNNDVVVLSSSGFRGTYSLPLLKDTEYVIANVFQENGLVIPDMSFKKINDDQELKSLINNLRILFEKSKTMQNESQDVINNDEDEVDNEEGVSQGSIPVDTILEELALATDVHPVSLYPILLENIQNGSWRSPSEEQRIAADLFTILILRLLGHRWPKQVEAQENTPEWADEDGIIPFSEDCGERTLLARLRDLISDEFTNGSINAIEQEFAEIMGSNLDKWIIGTFFKRHVSQFNKRPIAWHIQSSPSTKSGSRGKSSRPGVNNPAFSALLYYHKLSPTTILDIRKLYVDKLRVSYETEQRTLEGIAQPITEQSSRKIRLECWIDELKILDNKLEEVSRDAFGPEKMRSVLRQHAIDDAMLSLVACWLRRLSKTAQVGPLKSWQETAEKTKLHLDFPLWLHTATIRLDHYCSDVAPKSPGEKTLTVDPTSSDLAAIISSQAAAMVKGSLVKACDSWWKEFDEAVLLPLRQKINEADDKSKLLEEERDSTDCSTTRKMEIERLLKQLKAEIKGLKKEFSEKTEKAKAIRREMESWQCKEAGLWEGWLATQPLFDKFAQLDATKVAPSTIAEFIAQESAYYPDINNGVRVNIAPLQKAGLLAADVIASKDLDKAISDRADWRAEERRWCREGKLSQPGWWKAEVTL